ncbi:SRPBCC family protein [Neolewinella litorea]|uniref:SRPBCC domain-containing protein n=1 Tax=Neolewinella litorea TaxID=2562452 RepID=A0A4S4NAG0_9BACT|nr:SRPBCC domain-containing protein [Neolewinella litorea]THH36302.1 SRPBCC domain-containing protein [Neolewinella litorea]
MAVTLTVELPHPRSEVWAALTQPGQMREWYFENIPDFRPEVGFTTRFPMQSAERTFTAHWEVTCVVPGEEITYVWTYAEYPGAGPVTFRLADADGGTRVTVFNEGLETFPDDVPEFTEESCRGGWEYFLQQRLPAYLGG